MPTYPINYTSAQVQELLNRILLVPEILDDQLCAWVIPDELTVERASHEDFLANIVRVIRTDLTIIQNLGPPDVQLIFNDLQSKVTPEIAKFIVDCIKQLLPEYGRHVTKLVIFGPSNFEQFAIPAFIDKLDTLQIPSLNDHNYKYFFENPHKPELQIEVTKRTLVSDSLMANTNFNKLNLLVREPKLQTLSPDRIRRICLANEGNSHPTDNAQPNLLAPRFPDSAKAARTSPHNYGLSHSVGSSAAAAQSSISSLIAVQISRYSAPVAQPSLSTAQTGQHYRPSAAAAQPSHSTALAAVTLGYFTPAGSTFHDARGEIDNSTHGRGLQYQSAYNPLMSPALKDDHYFVPEHHYEGNSIANPLMSPGLNAHRNDPYAGYPLLPSVHEEQETGNNLANLLPSLDPEGHQDDPFAGHPLLPPYPEHQHVTNTTTNPSMSPGLEDHQYDLLTGHALLTGGTRNLHEDSNQAIYLVSTGLGAIQYDPFASPPASVEALDYPLLRHASELKEHSLFSHPTRAPGADLKKRKHKNIIEQEDDSGEAIDSDLPQSKLQRN